MRSKFNNQDSLRSRAEAQLAHAPPTEVSAPSADELLHELRVHQIEMELQNETLRQSQITLEESRDRYIDFYDFAPSAYITLNSDALITEINLTGATLLGEERRKLEYRRFANVVAPEDRDSWYRHFIFVLQHDSRQSCELAIQRSDGSRLYAQLDSQRLAKDGKAPVVRVALTDVTVRKLAEDALRESEKRRYLLEQQEIVQASLDGFWVVNAKNGQILEVNDIFCNMLGYSREEILAKGIHDLDIIETHDETKARIKKIRKIGYDRFETRQRHKRGHLIDLEVSVSHSEIDGGKNFAFFRDITERKRILAALSKSEENYRKLFENSRDALMTLAPPSWKFTSANLSTLQMFRALSDAEFTCLGPGDISPEQQPDGLISADKARQMIATAILKGSHFFEWTHKRLNGKTFPAEVLLTRIEQDGQVFIQSTIRDITERKRLEMEILERRNEMEFLQKKHVAAQTAAAIAHELNQPLLAITAYSKAALMLIKAEKPNLDKIHKAIEGSERQALRAGQSIRELIEFLSNKEFSTEAFDLNREIIDVIDAARQEHELQFDSILMLEEELPFVRANRTHLQKVLFNLLHNGIDAMKEAGVPLPAITVTVRTMRDENVAQVTIQDNGPGIKKEDFHRLFEPFFTTKANGIGMGLAISRALIEENGGQLWIDPQEGPGATFHLTLPFAS